ncbi:hypothetical protein HJC23_007168 [Cyclotella cryptica]|uniref:Uncharacterized protein n=1 Tax=Cyclotella cryptica TaxID=29204 RepID=A0ABD3QPT8_9STRA|eukprot:CCRYP_003448-RA/>CCRYP_003448-RA protein AED:0.01 eAED:0.01 QI:286/1/1/1/0/0.5/2/1957/670
MASRQEVRRRKNKPRPNNDTSDIISESAQSTSPSIKDESSKQLGERMIPKENNHNQASTTSFSKYDEYAWFIVFLLALSYFIITRSSGGQLLNHRGGLLSTFSKPYEVVASFVSVGTGGPGMSAKDWKEDEELLKSIFYIVPPSSRNSTTSSTNLLALSPSARLEIIISSPRDVYISNDDGNNATTNNSCPRETTCPSEFPPNTPPFLSRLLSTTWVHDTELGRGYLLIADGGRSGRIWRWEVGGGPITIGRSLHMERSGCRSGIWVDASDDGGIIGGRCPDNLFGSVRSIMRKEDEQLAFSSGSGAGLQSLTTLPPLLGTASVVVELNRDAERSTSGKNIVVAEWGEKRIVRVEGETGARTPLVTMLPVSPDEKDGLRRAFRPNHLTYTPFGDLLFSDSYEITDDSNGVKDESSRKFVGTIYRLREAVHVPPIPVDQSREAHGWTNTSRQNGENDDRFTDGSVDILFQTNGWIDGVALGGSDYSTLYVSVVTLSDDESDLSWTKTLYKLSLSADDEDDDAEDHASNLEDGNSARYEVFYSMTSKECPYFDNDAKASHFFAGSKLAIDERGTIYIITCPSSIVLLSNGGRVIGTLASDQLNADEAMAELSKREFTSINFGEDGYFYVTTAHELMRIKCRIRGSSIPTNLVLPPPSKDKQSKPRRDKRDKR